MKDLWLLLATALLIVACSPASPARAISPAPVTPEPTTGLPPGATALPIDTKLDHCIGDTTKIAALVRIDNGPRFWEVIPEQLDAPELEVVTEPLILAVYPGGWPGTATGAAGAPRPTHRPGTWDVCVEVESGAPVLGGAPFIVYGSISPEGARVSGL